MTVETTNSTISYTGNGSVTKFAYNFLTYSEDHLFIYLDDVEQTSGYSVSGVGDESGGDVTFDVAPINGEVVRIDRTVPETQLIEYQEYGPFPAKTNERGLDLGVMIAQQNAREIGRDSSKKMDKQPLAIEDNIVTFDDEGNSKDSGVNLNNSGVITDLNKVIPFEILDEAVNETNPLKIFDGAELNLAGRNTKNDGGGAMWDVVNASTVTPNTYDIVQCVGIPSLALVLRDEGALNAKSYGVVSGGVDTTVQLQAFFVEIAKNGRSANIPKDTYLVTSQVILPFADAPGDTVTLIEGNKCTFTSGVGVGSVGSSTNGCFISGRLDGSGNPVIVDSGNESYITANLVMQNINFSFFGTALRLHNFIFGCSLKNLSFDKCFNPMYLSRCFYLEQANILMQGFSPVLAGSVGYRCLGFSNVMPTSGVKVILYDRGFVVGGYDGGTIRDSSAESCNIGVDLAQESNIMNLETLYLEGNSTNIRFSAIVRRLTIQSSWLYGDGTNHFSSLLGNSDYSNITLINNRIWGGVINTPSIRNVFGEAIQSCGEDGAPTSKPIFSGLPNLVFNFSQYGMTTTTSGYNSTIRCLDNAQPSGLIPTSWSGGAFRDGRDTDDRSPFQVVVDNAGSLEFTSSYDFDINSMFHHSVKFSHNSGTIKVNLFIIYDHTADVFRCFHATAGGFVLNSDFSVDNDGGKLRVTAPNRANPVLDYSIIRIV
ncbi:MAG: DUF2460 domain-containing protein [Psychromonas sp.]|nr:DUF2460 domain-containing protein [Psychromonas sp.]